MPSRSRAKARHLAAFDEDGSVTAEFAIIVPAVLLVLALCVGALQTASLQIRVTDAAADAARTLARGDSSSTAQSRVASLVAGASLTSAHSGEFVCATVSVRGSFGPLAAVTVTGRSCAMDGGL